MFEKMTKQKKLSAAKELFMKSVDADVEWQGEAQEDFNFRDGIQWTADERRILEEELRPILTFNLTKSSIDLIMGMNEDNRIVHKASPVDPTDGFLAEVLNDITNWVAETNEFEDEEDDALESAAICGRGYVAIDFLPDPKKFGEIIMEEVSIPVREVHFDPTSRRPNFQDASHVCWDRWMPVEEFKLRYPKITGKRLEDIIEASGSFGLENAAKDVPQSSFDIPVDVSSDDSDYDMPLDLNFYDKTKGMVRVVHMEYWEAYKKYFVFNPETGLFEEVGEKKPSKLQQAQFLETFGQEMVIEEMMDKRVKWIQFTGDQLLYDAVSPLPFDGFSIVPMFAFKDVSKRTANHFGLVRLMKDPQKEVNKRWSQALNMLNQQVQPGVYAETEAFVDERQALVSMKESGSITWVQAGALTQGKLKERTVPTFPNAPMQMEQFSQDIMKKITGINPDLLGQDRGRQEPGVVIRLRQQQGVTLLKPLFKAYNRMKKGLFKRQLAIIMAYMPDAQVKRILGQNDRYQIQPDGTIVDMASMVEQEDPQTGEVVQVPTLTADIRDIRNLEYNLAAEEAPGNMTKRMLELTALMEMQAQGFPVDPNQIIDKMDIPASEKKRWMDYIAAQEQAQAQQAEEQMQTQVALETEKINVQKEGNMLDFITDMAKVKQMVQKDEGRMKEEFAKLDSKQRADLMNFVAQMASVAASVEATKVSTGKDLVKSSLDNMTKLQMSKEKPNGGTKPQPASK
jgi:hypothetical protein